MANQNKRNKVKKTATQIICGILAGLMVIGSIAAIISAFL